MPHCDQFENNPIILASLCKYIERTKVEKVKTVHIYVRLCNIFIMCHVKNKFRESADKKILHLQLFKNKHGGCF